MTRDDALFNVLDEELNDRVRNSDLRFLWCERQHGLRSTQVGELLRLLIDLKIITREQVVAMLGPIIELWGDSPQP